MCIFCSALFAGEGNALDTKKYKYTIEDFGALSVKPLHLDSIYDFGPKAFTNTTVGTYVYSQCLDKVPQTADLTEIQLDQNDLKVHSVEIIINNADNTLFKPADLELIKNDWVAHRAQFEGIPITAEEEKTWSNDSKLKFTSIENFVVDQPNQKLIIPLSAGQVIKPGQQFILRTVTTSTPNDYELEGMYFDTTPQGCPQQLISQNQQYGYRRMTPTIGMFLFKFFFFPCIIFFFSLLSPSMFLISSSFTHILSPFTHI